MVFMIVAVGVQGSVHEYKHATFRENGNAYLFYGGSEGIRASVAGSDNQKSGSVNNGKSYIKYVSNSFD